MTEDTKNTKPEVPAIFASNSRSIEARAAASHWGSKIDFLLRDKGMVGVAIQAREYSEHEFVEPTFSLSMQEAQELFNSLWHAGLRPRDGTGNSGHVAAISYHLEDMRRLVFKDKP